MCIKFIHMFMCIITIWNMKIHKHDICIYTCQLWNAVSWILYVNVLHIYTCISFNYHPLLFWTLFCFVITYRLYDHLLYVMCWCQINKYKVYGYLIPLFTLFQCNITRTFPTIRRICEEIWILLTNCKAKGHRPSC